MSSLPMACLPHQLHLALFRSPFSQPFQAELVMLPELLALGQSLWMRLVVLAVPLVVVVVA